MYCHRSHRRGLIHPSALVLVTFALAVASVAGAQTRLYIKGESVLLEGDTQGRLLRVLPLPPDTRCAPVATADGHFVVWVRRSGFLTYPVLFDTLSGGLTEFPPIDVGSSSCPYSDPHNVRVLFPNADTDRILILEPGGVRQIGATGFEGTTVALSAGGELFYTRAQDIAVVDAESGAVLRTVPVTGGVLAVSSDGRTLYVGRDDGVLNVTVVAHDAVTGAVLARWTVSGFLTFVTNIVLDELRNRVVVVTTTVFHTVNSTLYSLDASSLTQLGRRGVGLFGGVVVDPHVDRSYALLYRTPPFGGPCFETWVQALRTTDLTDLGRVTVFGSPDNTTPGDCGLIGLGAPPTAPAALSATVVNGIVTLVWSKPAFGVATEYQLEVGSVPGASDILVARIGPPTEFVSAAPPGVYYVRLRAGNALGLSPASAELRIAVP